MIACREIAFREPGSFGYRLEGADAKQRVHFGDRE